jgi:hypothetical protein
MISFVYITCRNNPKFEWFIDSLYNQVIEEQFEPSKIQIVLVDFELQYDETRKDKFKSIINNRFEFIHIEPKPSPVQGKYKITSKNYFNAGSARNTGICYVKHGYVAFIDDLTVLEKGSFKYIVEYATKNMVVGFSYKKVLELDVKDGIIQTKQEHPGGIDSRWNQGNDIWRIGGSQLYGYSASPLQVILSVNGYDEICNTMGGEDYQYGMRLEKTGTPIYYSKYVVFYESEEFADQGNVFIRRDPLLSNNDYNVLMKKYNVLNRWVPDGITNLSHFILDLLTRNKSWAEGNDYNLTDLRNKILAGGEFNKIFDPNIKTLEGLFLRDL